MNAVLLGRLFLTLVTVEEFGDKKPSQLLRWMQHLLGDAAGTNPDNKFLCELFLQHLPSQIRMVLASAGEMSLEALAQLAEVATPFVSTLNLSPLMAEVEQLCLEVACLQDMLASVQLAFMRQRPSRQHTSSRPSSRSSNPKPSTSPDGLCWYHRRLGEQAHKCTSSCSWSGNPKARC